MLGPAAPHVLHSVIHHNNTRAFVQAAQEVLQGKEHLDPGSEKVGRLGLVQREEENTECACACMMRWCTGEEGGVGRGTDKV